MLINISFDREGFPLAIVDFPGLDCEMTSDDLRAMASTLLYTANQLDQTPPRSC